MGGYRPPAPTPRSRQLAYNKNRQRAAKKLRADGANANNVDFGKIIKKKIINVYNRVGVRVR